MRAPFSEILDPPLVLVVADGRGAGLKRGGGGSEYLKTALIFNQHAFIKIWESQMSSLPL